MVLIKKKQNAKSGLNYRPSCLLMGRVGDGKTTLVNMLCGTSHSTSVGTGSVTRKLYSNTSSYGNSPFDIIDTPGTESNEEAFKHAYLLKHALTAKPLNTIFILVKYESRYNLIVERYESVLKPIANYEKKCVILISNMDLAQNKKEEFTAICKLFKDNDIDANIIFYSKDTDKSELSNAMFDCISNMDNTQLTITDVDFYTNFKISSIPKVRQMRRSFEECKAQIENISQWFKQALSSQGSIQQDEKDEWLHGLIVSHTNHLHQVLEGYQKKFQNDMHDIDYYFFSIEMQAVIIKKGEDFVYKTKELMSYDLFDKSDPRNLIKQCPNCLEIWIKTEGCDGLTNCGNVPMAGEINFNFFKRLKFNFYVDLNDSTNKIKWNKSGKKDIKEMIDRFEIYLKDYKTVEDIDACISLINQINVYIHMFTEEEIERVLTILGQIQIYSFKRVLIRLGSEIFNGNFGKVKTSAEKVIALLNEAYEDLRRKRKNEMKKKEISNRGCGHSFVWKDQPPLKKELICDIFMVNTIDIVKEILNNENVQQKLNEKINLINTDFHC